MSGDVHLQHRLLQSLAEELKLPLLQIARQAELAEESSPQVLAPIRQTAEMSLKLIEGYLLSLETSGQQALQLEPVSVASVLYDTAHALAPLADTYNCDIELDIAGRYGPVMTDKDSLETALLLIGYNMIDGRPIESRRHRLVLACHNSKRGLVAGLFDGQPRLSREMLKRGSALLGSARQALPGALAGSGAGLFIAGSLLEAMSSPLHAARHRKLSGLAATLTLSKQLQLV